MRVQPGDEATVHVEHFNQTVVDRYGDEQPGPQIFGAWWDDGESGLRSPFGAPGDRLWAREAWRASVLFDHEPPRNIPECAALRYEADSEPLARGQGQWGKYRHARFMPRWASRIQLEIAAERVERVQSISEADAKAEGCERLRDSDPGYVERDEPNWKLCPQCGGTRLYTSYGPNMGACFDTDCTLCDTYRKRYRYLWDSINGKTLPWEANPWCWVIEFRRIPLPAGVQPQGNGGRK